MLRMDSYSLCLLPGPSLLDIDTAPLTPTLPSPNTPDSPSALFLPDPDPLAAAASPRQQAAQAAAATAAATGGSGWQQVLPFASTLALKAEPSCELMMDLTRSGLVPPAESDPPLQAAASAALPATAAWDLAFGDVSPPTATGPLLPPPPALRICEPFAVHTPHGSLLPRTLPAARPPPVYSSLFASIAAPAPPRPHPEGFSSGAVSHMPWGLGPMGMANPRLAVPSLLPEQPGQPVGTTGVPPSTASPALANSATVQGQLLSPPPTAAPAPNTSSAANSQVSSRLPAGGVPRVGSTVNLQKQGPAPDRAAVAEGQGHGSTRSSEEVAGEEEDMGALEELPASVKSLPHASFLTPPSKRRGKGGRQPAPDPRQDPSMDPKRAQRIMANRLSAAKSKMNQKKRAQTLQEQLDAASQQHSTLALELQSLQESCTQAEQEQLALRRQIQALEGGRSA